MPKWHSFFSDLTGRFFGQRRRLYETHLFRQDLQDIFCLICQHPVYPVDPVRKTKLYFVKFFIRLNWALKPIWMPDICQYDFSILLS
jgi:hypothetical protein